MLPVSSLSHYAPVSSHSSNSSSTTEPASRPQQQLHTSGAAELVADRAYELRNLRDTHGADRHGGGRAWGESWSWLEGQVGTSAVDALGWGVPAKPGVCVAGGRCQPVVHCGNHHFLKPGLGGALHGADYQAFKKRGSDGKSPQRIHSVL